MLVLGYCRNYRPENAHLYEIFNSVSVEVAKKARRHLLHLFLKRRTK